MKDSKNSGAYGKYGREGKCRQGFDEESHEKIVSGVTYAWLRAVCITEMDLKETWRQVVDPIRLA